MMKRGFVDFYLVNGVPLLAPDRDVEVSYEDIDAADAGRDEAGYMHRNAVRYKVGKWNFVYTNLTEEEHQYLENIFPDEESFEFTHPSRKNSNVLEVTTCYRSKCSGTWRNARSGKWKTNKFNVIEY